MSLRLIAAVVIAILFALAQIQAGVGGTPSAPDAVANLANRFSPSVASADNGEDDENSDDDDDDDDDNSGDDDDDDDNSEDEGENDEEDEDNSDDEDSDNEDEDSDNDDSDDDDDDDDDFQDADNGDSGDGGYGGVAPTLPDLEAVGTSNGGDVSVALAGDRLILKMFPWMPTGITVTVRKVYPVNYAFVPGKMVGDLMFAVEARDAFGNQLQNLPAEVNLSIHYNDSEIRGMSESGVTISRLNPLSNQWQPAPKLFRDANWNYIASSLTEIGVFVVHVP